MSGERTQPPFSARQTASVARLSLALLRRAPERPALVAAAAFGRSWARLSLPRTDTARRNLRIAFPEWSEAERRAVLADSFANVARSFVEFAQFPGLGAEALRERMRVEGIEHLEKARADSPTGGVIVLTGHFGSWELLAACMSAVGFPLSVVQRPRDDDALDELVAELRGAGGAEVLPRGNAARGALRALRQGRLLAMPYDQNCSRDEGVFVPFFGRLACTRHGPARIAMRMGIPVLPVFVFREPDGFHHRVVGQPPLQLVVGAEALAQPEAALRENVARMTRVIEDAIRGRPDHWTWGHRRWRTQPAGEPRPYPSRRG